MAFKSRSASPFATAFVESLGASYSYSRKRRDGFSLWQEHLRKLAGSVGSAPAKAPHSAAPLFVGAQRGNEAVT
jgi:hypothetical protein